MIILFCPADTDYQKLDIHYESINMRGGLLIWSQNLNTLPKWPGPYADLRREYSQSSSILRVYPCSYYQILFSSQSSTSGIGNIIQRYESGK